MQVDHDGHVKREQFASYVQRSYAEESKMEEIKKFSLECTKAVNLRAKGK
jgi:hypothetical protein